MEEGEEGPDRGRDRDVLEFHEPCAGMAGGRLGAPNSQVIRTQNRIISSSRDSKTSISNKMLAFRAEWELRAALAMEHQRCFFSSPRQPAPLQQQRQHSILASALAFHATLAFDTGLAVAFDSCVHLEPISACHTLL